MDQLLASNTVLVARWVAKNSVFLGIFDVRRLYRSTMSAPHAARWFGRSCVPRFGASERTST